MTIKAHSRNPAEMHCENTKATSPQSASTGIGPLSHRTLLHISKPKDQRTGEDVMSASTRENLSHDLKKKKWQSAWVTY